MLSLIDWIILTIGWCMSWRWCMSWGWWCKLEPQQCSDVNKGCRLKVVCKLWPPSTSADLLSDHCDLACHPAVLPEGPPRSPRCWCCSRPERCPSGDPVQNKLRDKIDERELFIYRLFDRIDRILTIATFLASCTDVVLIWTCEIGWVQNCHCWEDTH